MAPLTGRCHGPGLTIAAGQAAMTGTGPVFRNAPDGGAVTRVTLPEYSAPDGGPPEPMANRSPPLITGSNGAASGGQTLTAMPSEPCRRTYLLRHKGNTHPLLLRCLA